MIGQIIDNALRRKAYDALLAAAGSGGIDPGYDIKATRRRQRQRRVLVSRTAPRRAD